MADGDKEPTFDAFRHWEAYAIIAAACLSLYVAGPIGHRTGRDPVRVATGVFLGLAAWLIFRGARKVMAERLRYDRKRQGRCVDCGYDLSGGVERCPECGAALPQWPHAVTKAPDHPVVYIVVMSVLALGAAVAVMFHTMAAQSGH